MSDENNTSEIKEVSNKKKILMVSGGIGDQTAYEINVYHISKQTEFGKYNVQHCVIIPDGSIKFPKNLEKSEIENAKKFSIFEGCIEIQKMGIDCIFYIANSWKALTDYRTIFEQLDIPIVGPSAESQGLAFNKIITRARMMAEGVQCAPGCIIRYEERNSLEKIKNKMELNKFSFPCIVKAPCDDDSLGVYVVKEESNLIESVEKAFSLQNKSEILIEKFIPGRELRTAIIQDENQNDFFLPSVEFKLETPNDIRGLEVKQKFFLNDTRNQNIKKNVPDRLFLDEEKEGKLIQRLKEISLICNNALKIHDYGIYDFRYDPVEDEIYFLEAGLANWFSKNSNITINAAHMGITQETIIDNCFNNSLKRYQEQKKFVKN